MSDAFFVIRSLAKEGKGAAEIARQLYERGIRNELGNVISTAMVEGFMRFIGGTDGDGMFGPIEAAWGTRKHERVESTAGGFSGAQPKKRRNRGHAGQRLGEELKADIVRLYREEGVKPNEIAEVLGVHFRKIWPFIVQLSGFSVPPGEITVYTDKDGKQVTKCPPGYADGVFPQKNVRPTQGGW